MELPAQFDGVERTVLPARPLHLVIGMFDGLHVGHRTVIDAALRSARAAGALCGVLTFWPHPSALFRPESRTKLMQPAATKARMLNRLGVDAVITQPFTPEFAGIAAEEFVPWLRQRLPGLASIHVGENFRFGRGRRGDAALLAASGRQHGVQVFAIPRASIGGEPVSSTRIRGLLEAGEIAAANTLLGYAYFAHGYVVPGKRLGRTIGFPTLNLPWTPELTPRFGVYAVRVSGEKAAAPLPAVANYGVRPTVENTSEPRLEIHVIGACAFGEGDHLKAEWLHFLRPEMKFAGLDALRAQIAQDRLAAEAFFAR